MLDEAQKPIEVSLPRKTSLDVRRTQSQQAAYPSPEEQQGIVRKIIKSTTENPDMVAGGLEIFLWKISGGFFVAGAAYPGWFGWVLVLVGILCDVAGAIICFIKHKIPQGPTMTQLKQIRNLDDVRKTFGKH